MGAHPLHEEEHRRVLKIVSSVVDTFPSLNAGPYAQWLLHLMGDPRSHISEGSDGAEAMGAASSDGA